MHESSRPDPAEGRASTALWLALCRNGEESRTYLIQLSEKYLGQHALDGYEPSTSNREVVLLRPSVEAGKLPGFVCQGLSCAPFLGLSCKVG